MFLGTPNDRPPVSIDGIPILDFVSGWKSKYGKYLIINTYCCMDMGEFGLPCYGKFPISNSLALV